MQKRLLSNFRIIPIIWQWLVAKILLLLCELATVFALPLVTQQIIDNGLLGQNQQITLRYSIYLVLLGLALFGIYTGIYTIGRALEEKAANQTRLSLIRHYHTLDAIQRQTAERDLGMLALLQTDVSAVGTVLNAQLNFAFGIISALLVCGTIIYLAGWRGLLLIVVTVFVGLLPLFVLGKPIRVQGKRKAKNNAAMTKRWEEQLAHTEQIRGWGLLETELDDTKKRQDTHASSSILLRFFQQLQGINHLTTRLLEASVYLLAAVFLWNGTATIGWILAIVSYIQYLDQPIFEIANNINLIRSQQGHLERLSIFCHLPALSWGKKSSTLPLVVSSVGFSYGEAPVFTDVSLTVTAGDIVAITGENGSGKSTLLQLVYRLLPAETNGIRLGASLEQLQKELFYQTVTADFLSFSLWNPSISYYLTAAGCDKEVFAAVLSTLWDATACKRTLQDKKDITQLSAGETQKILFAISVSRKPALLLLDEAFASLDPSSRAVAKDLLQELVENQTIGAVLMINHHEEFQTIANKSISLS